MSEADSESKKPTLKEPLRAAFSRWWGTSPLHIPEASSNALAVERTDMAASRTLMAADRTLMAWLRTSLSLDSFGFTIYKVLQGLAQGGVILRHSDTPRTVGLFMTGMGTLAMLMGTVEYAQALKDLHTYVELTLLRPAFIMAVLMSIMGLALFFIIFTKV